MDKEKAHGRKITSKQVVAIIGIVLLILMYIMTLVTAIADSSASAKWFRLSLFGTLAIPLVIWIYTWMYARLTGKHAIGDPDNESVPTEDIPSEK